MGPRWVCCLLSWLMDFWCVNRSLHWMASAAQKMGKVNMFHEMAVGFELDSLALEADIATSEPTRPFSSWHTNSPTSNIGLIFFDKIYWIFFDRLRNVHLQFDEQSYHALPRHILLDAIYFVFLILFLQRMKWNFYFQSLFCCIS